MLEAGNACQLISYEGGRHGYLIFDLNLFDNNGSDGGVSGASSEC